jgi:hypothetical protein
MTYSLTIFIVVTFYLIVPYSILTDEGRSKKR